MLHVLTQTVDVYKRQLQEVIAHFTETEPRGEIVIILGGKEN